MIRDNDDYSNGMALVLVLFLALIAAVWVGEKVGWIEPSEDTDPWSDNTY